MRLPSMHRLDLLSTVIVAVTLIRLLLVCLSNPIAAYANNYDFVRQSACVGIWEQYPHKDKTLSNPERPVNALVFDGDRRPDVCLASSDNLFPWLVGSMVGSGAHTELRTVGFAKAIVAIGCLLFILMQPVGPVLRLAMAVAGGLIFGDIALLSYFDTLYLDASVIIFGFAVAGMVVAMCCGATRPRVGALLFFIAAVAWLGFAKQQYAPFAAVAGLVGAAGVGLRWRTYKTALAIILPLLAVQWIGTAYFAGGNTHTQNIRKANLADTFLGAVLPMAADRPAALRITGLPPSCAAAIGLDWYSANFQQDNPCPAVYQESRARLLGLFIADPHTLTGPLARGIQDSRPAYLSYLGHYENPGDHDRIRFRVLRATSLSMLLAALPEPIYFAFILALCLLGPAGLVTAAYRMVWRREGAAVLTGAALMAGLGGTLVAYALVSTVFGDGFAEVQRHSIGIEVGASFVLGSLVALVFR